MYRKYPTDKEKAEVSSRPDGSRSQASQSPDGAEAAAYKLSKRGEAALIGAVAKQNKSLDDVQQRTAFLTEQLRQALEQGRSLPSDIDKAVTDAQRRIAGEVSSTAEAAAEAAAKSAADTIAKGAVETAREVQHKFEVFRAVKWLMIVISLFGMVITVVFAKLAWDYYSDDKTSKEVIEDAQFWRYYRSKNPNDAAELQKQYQKEQRKKGD